MPAQIVPRHRARPVTAFTLAVVFLFSPAARAAEPGPLPSDAEGFYFLAGEWQVQHRRLKDPWGEREEWNNSEGSAGFQTLVSGLVSVEELRDAKGVPFGGAVRTFDRERRVWSDSWLGVRDGILQPGVIGRFDGPVGTFTAPDTYKDRVILVRGVWRRVSAGEFTWEQFFSRDNGASWQLTWHMRFLRKTGSASR
jgi:hypothetical protein